MANKEIGDLTTKTVLVDTDEFPLQATGKGTTQNTTYATLNKAPTDTVQAEGSLGGGNVTIDFDDGRVISGTVDTAETTFIFSNLASGDYAELWLTNGGSQTVNWPADVDWPGGTAVAMTAAGVDGLGISKVGTIVYMDRISEDSK